MRIGMIGKTQQAYTPAHYEIRLWRTRLGRCASSEKPCRGRRNAVYGAIPSPDTKEMRRLRFHLAAGLTAMLVAAILLGLNAQPRTWTPRMNKTAWYGWPSKAIR